MKTQVILCIAQNSENRPVILSVYNATTHSTREVCLTPSTNWPGEGLLGIKIKLNCYDGSLNVDVNVANVYEKVE